VIFAQLVDDPSSVPEEFPTKEAQESERERLFRLIEQLILWENSSKEVVLQPARDEISKTWRRACADNADHPLASVLFDPDKLPAFHDPFAGGGSLPLEAQRLSLEAHASDLNPVAVLINKAMIEIPPRFAGHPPINPESRAGRGSISTVWKSAAGLAEDVRYYRKWMRDEAEKRIGHLYPKVLITPEIVAERPDLAAYAGRELMVIAWIWARTVKSPNPAYASVDVPLASTFMLSSKAGKEAYVEPIVQGSSYRFTVKVGKPGDAGSAKNGTKTGGSHSPFRCLLSGTTIPFEYIRIRGKEKELGARLMAVVAEGDRGRVYLPPNVDQLSERASPQASWKPEVEISHWPGRTNVVEYGLATFGDLFTPRQLVALTTFTDLVGEARERVRQDAIAAGLADDARSLEERGVGANAYADALAVYLACAVDRMIYYGSTITTWLPKDNALRDAMPRQALAMTWDYAECNPLAKSSGDAITCIGTIANFLDFATPNAKALVEQGAAQQSHSQFDKYWISTDPPYYANVSYSDLSDYFYVWLRRSLGAIYPELFGTIATPKELELVANPYRHGGKAQARVRFLAGMTKAMEQISESSVVGFPISIYYAFNQSEADDETGDGITEWETFLRAVLDAGLAITGTWPLRTEGAGRILARDSNALASSIVLVCRARAPDARSVTRTEFLQELTQAMREALPVMTSGQIAPVDLAQASIGPGMAVYSRYSQVLRQDGKPVTVREALQDINNAISAYRTERTSSFDQRTRFCIDFYDQFGFSQADFDNATVLARAQAVGVDTLEREDLLLAERGKARLVQPASYPTGVAGLERRFRGSAWEACMRLAATLQEEGESATAALARQLGEGICARARELAVWLYTIADARKRTQDALAFNALDASWPEIQRLMASMDRGGETPRLSGI
jgi:putative DNA methylase